MQLSERPRRRWSIPDQVLRVLQARSSPYGFRTVSFGVTDITLVRENRISTCLWQALIANTGLARHDLSPGRSSIPVRLSFIITGLRYASVGGLHHHTVDSETSNPCALDPTDLNSRSLQAPVPHSLVQREMEVVERVHIALRNRKSFDSAFSTTLDLD